MSADLLVIPTIILCVWFGAMLFTGYPRMLEPYLPLILFGNCSPLVWLARKVVARFALPQSRAEPIVEDKKSG